MNSSKIYDDDLTLNRYRDYLLDLCRFPVRIRSKYTSLMDSLLFFSFTPLVELDTNRAADGIELRNGFLRSDRPASVLEVLIAFSIRIDREYIGFPGDPHPEIIFSEMLDNLDLFIYTNNYFSIDKVANIVDRFVGRHYTPKGEGNIFPLPNTQNDQRKVDMWGQMNEYVNTYYRNGYRFDIPRRRKVNEW